MTYITRIKNYPGPREYEIQAAYIRSLRRQYPELICVEVKTAWIPDRLFVLPDGKVKFVEFKTSTGRLSPRQRLMLAKLHRLGHDATVLRE